MKVEKTCTLCPYTKKQTHDAVGVKLGKQGEG